MSSKFTPAWCFLGTPFKNRQFEPHGDSKTWIRFMHHPSPSDGKQRISEGRFEVWDFAAEVFG